MENSTNFDHDSFSHSLKFSNKIFIDYISLFPMQISKISCRCSEFKGIRDPLEDVNTTTSAMIMKFSILIPFNYTDSEPFEISKEIHDDCRTISVFSVLISTSKRNKFRVEFPEWKPILVFY
ncbi:hypothetical protein RF11_05953 [Thelohanellus kitauei]|uniref:Uncharacterized protein n=1 Tax=Thelohanellus kitauei TaxID=669202 RepID=A0A0C2MTD4_THEKT|nr:hypothetical protein RF11_05953 [Thelohanellus kitauei]